MGQTPIVIATLQPPYLSPWMRSIEAHGRALGMTRDQVFDPNIPDQQPMPNFIHERAKATLVAAILASIPPELANDAHHRWTPHSPRIISTKLYTTTYAKNSGTDLRTFATTSRIHSTTQCRRPIGLHQRAPEAAIRNYQRSIFPPLTTRKQQYLS